jgi:integrase
MREDVEAVLDRWSGFKPASLNNAISQLSGFFTWACRKRYASENPCRYIEKWEVNNQRTRWLRRHEIEKLLWAARELDQEWLCDHIQFAAATGLRLSRVCDLRRAEYFKDEKGNEYVEIEKDKNGAPVYKSLHGKIVEMVRRRVLRAPGPSSLIFGGPRGGTARSSIYRWLPEIAKKAGLVYGRGHKEGITFHVLRHTMAAQALNDGIPWSEIKAMGNWRTDTVAERYAHLSDERKRKAEAKVADLICGSGEGA